MRRFLLLFLGWASFATAQPPPLYIHIVSHNEPTDTLQQPARYARAKANALQLAAIVDAKNAKWNLQTSDGFVFGARQDQSTSGTNIFSTLSAPPYDDNIEIDPRSKNFPGRNIADQWYLLDSLGAHPTTTVGGFIYYVCPPGNQNLIDWWPYTDTLAGNVYGNRVRFDLLSGAGSLEPHCNDLNDFGVFKPDTTTNFYQHNPARELWCIGTGCAPLLDSMVDEQSIIDQIRREVDSIQQGLWPPDRFYVTRIMTNQREYGPMFFQKIARVIDSLNTFPAGQLQWATIRESFDAFLNWRDTNGIDFSQWQCGQILSGLPDIGTPAFSVYPNPTFDRISFNFADRGIHQLEILSAEGRCVWFGTVSDDIPLELPSVEAGIYWLKLEDGNVTRLMNF